MMDRTPSMADYFPVWSANTAGMVQLTVWTALEAEGLGASLQVRLYAIDVTFYLYLIAFQSLYR